MIGTLFSILIAIFLWFHPLPQTLEANAMLGIVMILVGVPFLFFFPVGTMLAWLPLQKAEQNSTPRILEMFRTDNQVNWTSAWMVIFALASLMTALDLIYTHFFDQRLLIPLWFVLLGLAVDAARHYVRRVMSYLNPFAVVKIFTKKAKNCIQNEREIDLCHWIDALSEVAVKGIQRHSTALTHLVLGEEQNIARIFLEASKSIGHHAQDKQTKALGITDKVSYTMFYLYQRLDLIFEKALKNKLESICSYIITLLGKISIDAAKYDVSMASVPLRYLGKFAKKAQDEGMEEATLTASCIFSEVAKAMLTEIDITYYEIKDPFLSIINGMETLAKGAFRRDKSMNIALLIQPFKELKELFETGKAKEHQDTPLVLQNINRVLGEFEALQMVMNTLPTIPDISETEIPPSPTPTSAPPIS